MSIGEKSSRAIKIWIVAATLLVAPRLAKPAAALGSNEALTESWQDQDAQDRGQEARDREQ